MPEVKPGILWKTLFIGLAVVFLLNLAASVVLDKYSQNRGYTLVQKKWEMLFDLDSAVDILVIGDSSGNSGVDTDLIEALTGQRAVNLATTGDVLALGNYWLLQEYIARFGPPRCVIEVHAYDTWYRRPSASVSAKIPLPLSEILSYFAESKLGMLFYIKYFVAKYVRAYSENISLQQILMYPWAVSDKNISLSATGFAPFTEALPAHVLSDANRHKDFVRKNVFQPARANASALHAMGKLADQYGFGFYIVNSPMYEGLYADDNLRRYLTDVNRFIDAIAAEYPHMQHLFAAPVTFSENEMENVDHLIPGPAKNYTRNLLRHINCGQ